MCTGLSQQMEQSFRNITTFFFIQRTLKIVTITDTKPRKMGRGGICWHTDESPHDWNFLPPGECVSMGAVTGFAAASALFSRFLAPLLFLLVVHLEDIYCKTFPWITQMKTKVSIFTHWNNDTETLANSQKCLRVSLCLFDSCGPFGWNLWLAVKSHLPRVSLMLLCGEEER